MTKRLWGEMFSEQPDEAVLAFMAGRDVVGVAPCDEDLIPYDLATNRAHAAMLMECSIIPDESGRRILEGLDALAERHAAGDLRLDPALEDVHSNIERALADLIGDEHAGHLHTARSRNDQVLCDMRLWERDAADGVASAARRLAETLLDLASAHGETIMPGFTHHQHATLTTFGHVLAGFAGGVIRTAERAAEWRARFNRCPLGAVTSYGTTFPIDRDRTAGLLGFDGVEESSLDSVHTRGEAEAELVGLLELGLAHLASLSASLILLATPEFDCLRIADSYSSGSSIMPQKRNPDSLEVIKARAAAVAGCAQALRSLTGRSLFGYNREQQWTKYLVMDAVREGLPCFDVLAGALRSLTVNRERMRELTSRGFLGATPLVELLCSERGLPFRTAKSVVSRAVGLSAAAGRESVAPADLRAALAEYELSIEVTDADVAGWQAADLVLPRLSHLGGPAPEAVHATIRALSERLASASGRARATG